MTTVVLPNPGNPAQTEIAPIITQLASQASQIPNPADPATQPVQYKTILQGRVESGLLQLKGSNCPLNQVTKVSLDLESLQLNSLKDALENRFFDLNLMQAVACLFDGIVYTPDNNVNFNPSQGIRHWLTLVKAIGSPSVNGVAMLGGLRNLNDLFILKVAQIKPGEITEYVAAKITHEYFVAAMGTNLLRAYDPGYSYIFAKFPCGGPGFTDKEVLTFCGSAEPRDYLVYEKITGESWSDNLKTWTPQQFLVAWLQLLNSLSLGNQLIGFSHNDLHGDNILLRQIAVPVSFAINLGPIQGYVTTNTIPTMIDFGYSQIKYGGLSFGIYGAEKGNVVPGQTRPLNDVHKIFFYSLAKTLRYGRLDLFNDLRNLGGYFYDLNTITPEFVNNLGKDYFYYKAPIKLLRRPISDYAKWLTKNIPVALQQVLTAEPLTQTLACQAQGGCQLDVTTSLNALGINLANPATNQMDLQDLAEAFTVAQTDGLYRVVLTRQFEIDQAKYLAQVDEYFQQIITQQNQVDAILAVSQGNLDFAEKLKRLAEISELLLRTSISLKILISLKDLFNNPGYNQNLVATVNRDTQQRAIFKPLVKQIRAQVPDLYRASLTDRNLSKQVGGYLLTIGSLGY